MKLIKTDCTIIKEAKEKGLMVGMTGEIERKRTALNNRLNEYFRKHMPKYTGSFSEDEGERILFSINNYLEENKIDKPKIDFPISSGMDVHLIPINENVQLKVIVTDEYYGDGIYEKYVMADFFMINEDATENDVDKLIDFVQEYLEIA
ncbi:hypothetical protein SMD22_01955 (plasmid) [Brevibacillus halotolerans]|nr:hypothetical protein SMD22_01955 [Brevibacillus halotolerans]